ncbi:MAG: potassium channel family protein [Rhizobiaceae bacterium]|nr:potassium channel family protein [Rhizobiaceae bacterium]
MKYLKAINTPAKYGAVYLLIIMAFALFFWIHQGFAQTKEASFLDCFYFSIITITTLGYGDLTPVSSVAKILSASEALLGVVTIGLFLWALSKDKDDRQHKMLRKNLLEFYNLTKRELALSILWVSRHGGRDDLHSDQDTIEQMLNVDGFRSLFEGGSAGNEGFYAFRNGITDNHQYGRILFSLALLANRIHFTLQSGAISNDEAFDKLKHLEEYLIDLDRTGPGYDEEKRLSTFLWKIFAGHLPTHGPLGYDPIEKLIKDAK